MSTLTPTSGDPKTAYGPNSDNARSPLTLFDLIAMLQNPEASDQDSRLVAMLSRWLRTGRITFVNENAPPR